MCYKLGIQAVFKSGNTLRQSLMRVKSRRRDEQKKGVVYEVPCGGCNQVYIGETGRSLEVRLKEHKYAVDSQHEQWHCSTCLELPASSQLGWSQSQML